MSGRRRLTREAALAALGSLDWRSLGVEWAVLYGSLARRGEGRDVDLLVEAPEARGDRMIPRLLDIVLRVADALGVDPGLVDVVEFSAAPCAVVLDAWRHGVTVYESRQGLARERLLVRVKVCHDYAVSRARLRIVQTAAEAMRRRWG